MNQQQAEQLQNEMRNEVPELKTWVGQIAEAESGREWGIGIWNMTTEQCVARIDNRREWEDFKKVTRLFCHLV